MSHVNLRLTEQASEALDVLVARWEMSKTQVIQTMIVQLARREDITCPSRLGEQAAGHRDTLIALRAELDRVIRTTAETT